MEDEQNTDPSHPSSRPRPARRRWLGIPGLRGALIGTGEPAPPASPKPSKQGQKQLSGKLAGLSLTRQVWVLSLWPMLEQFLNFLVGTVDFAIAGRLPGDDASREAFNAIGVASFFVWLMTVLPAAVGVGASALVSRAIGASHRRLVNAGVGQSLLLGVGTSVVAAIAVFASAPWIAQGFGLQGDAVSMAATYIRITALGIPMCGALFVGSSVLRAAGDALSPFYVMLLVNLVNVTASIGLGGVQFESGGSTYQIGLAMGVTGIALGTALAWTAGGFVILALLLSGRSGIRLRRHRLLPHWHTMRRIIRIAMPNLGYQGAFWGINLGLLFYISMLDDPDAIGAHSIAMRIKSVSFMPGFAIAVAASTLTGQYLGLGDPARARRATYIAMNATILLVSFCGVFFFFTPQALVSVLSQDAVHLELVPPLLQIAAVAMPLLAVNLILNGALQGAGDTRNAAIINLTGLITLRLGGAYLLAFPVGWGLRGIWIAFMFDISVRAIVFWFYYRTGRWSRVSV